jgi:hypothetical protein
MTYYLNPYADFEDFVGLKNPEDGTPEIKFIRANIVFKIEQFLHRKLEYKENYMETFLQEDKQSITRIPLARYPVSQINEIKINDEILTTDDYIMLGNGYGVKIKKEIEEDNVITAKYNGGYSKDAEDVLQLEDSDDAVIRQAALMQCLAEYRKRQSPDQQEISDAQLLTKVKEPELRLLKEVKRMLTPCKHPMKAYNIAVGSL